jgi:hypothetical protein
MLRCNGNRILFAVRREIILVSEKYPIHVYFKLCEIRDKYDKQPFHIKNQSVTPHSRIWESLTTTHSQAQLRIVVTKAPMPQQ